MLKGPRERTESEDVLRRLFDLCTREQLDVYLVLREYLGAKLDDETEFDRQLRRRDETLQAMQSVAAKLGLAPGVAPTAQQFNTTCKQLGLASNSTAVAEAWGRYRNATRAFRGERVPETPAQRSIRRFQSGKRRSHETYLAGVRLWLGQEPPPRTTTVPDYDKFVASYNSAIIAGSSDQLPLVKAITMRHSLSLAWGDILACAMGADYVELAARRERERLAKDAGPLGLVGAHVVALMLGMSCSDLHYHRKMGRLPTPVAYLGADGAAHPAWLAEDIAAYRDGCPFPARREGELQSLVLTTRQLAQELGLEPDSVRTCVQRDSPGVPQPQGRVGQTHYWTREFVDEWKCERSQRPNEGGQWHNERRRYRYRQRERPERELPPVDTGPLGLVGSSTVTVMLGMSCDQLKREVRNGHTLPRPVAYLSPQHPVWLAEDIVAYRNGRGWLVCREQDVQALFLTSRQLAEELGITSGSLTKMVRRGLATVPQPQGQVDGYIQ